MSRLQLLFDQFKAYHLDNLEINFSLGPVSEKLNESTVIDQIFQIKQDEFLLNCNDCRLFISKGTHLTVDYLQNLNTTQDWIQGLATAILLMQRGHLVLHGNAFSYGQRAFILAGDSESGKSSLAASFHQRGALFQSDELSCFKNDSAKLLPGFPFLRLWPETISSLKLNELQTRTLWDKENKLALDTSTQRYNDVLKADYLIFLSCEHDCQKVSLEKLCGLSKLEYFLKSLYRPEFLEIMDPDQHYMKQVSSLINEIDIYLLKRPRDKNTLTESTDLIEKILVQSDPSSH